jgi:hypothetical protein
MPATTPRTSRLRVPFEWMSLYTPGLSLSQLLKCSRGSCRSVIDSSHDRGSVCDQVVKLFSLVARQGELAGGAVDALVAMLDDPPQRSRGADQIERASAQIRELRHEAQRVLFETSSPARSVALRALLDQLAALIRPISRAARYSTTAAHGHQLAEAADLARIVGAAVLAVFSAASELAHLDRLSVPLPESDRVRQMLAEIPPIVRSPRLPPDGDGLAEWIANRALLEALADAGRAAADTLARVETIVEDFSLSQR